MRLITPIPAANVNWGDVIGDPMGSQSGLASGIRGKPGPAGGVIQWCLGTVEEGRAGSGESGRYILKSVSRNQAIYRIRANVLQPQQDKWTPNGYIMQCSEASPQPSQCKHFPG